MENFRPFSGRRLFSELSKKLNLSESQTSVFYRIMATMLVIVFVSGCYNFYKTKTTNFPQAGQISPLIHFPRSFVIHCEQDVFILNNVYLLGDSLKGSYAGKYVFPYKKNSFPEENSTNRYRVQKGDKRIINEVHLYMKQSDTTLAKRYIKTSFAVNDITKMDVYSHNGGRTLISFAAGFITFVFVVPLLFILIGALIGASCPYIYVNTGDGFAFAGEIYSGAVYAPLERNDYLALPRLVAENGIFKLKISNELREIQYTNLMQLMVIDHPANTEVLIDKYGHYQTFTEPHTPLTAVNLSGIDILGYINNKDDLSYSSIPSDMDIPLTDGVIMTFDLPKNVSSVKLFLKARNSIWLDYVYKNSHELFGSYYDNWVKKQNKADKSELMEGALKQKIPLSVYIEKNGEWEFCDYFNMAGPAALKEDVLAIDLKGLGEGNFKVKLESGTCFWDIDYVGIDYSLNVPVNLTEVQIEKAITNDEMDVADLLKFDDMKYYVQSEINNIADLTFKEPPVSSSKRSVILHSKGHYEILSEGKGLPKIKKLKELQKPGAFPEFSRDLLRTEIYKFHNNK